MPAIHDWSAPGPNNTCHTCYGDGEIGINTEEGAEKCPDCDGTGIEGHITCPECGGQGSWQIDSHVDAQKVCETCDGDGNIPKPITCPNCNGSGDDPFSAEMLGKIYGPDVACMPCNTCNGDGNIPTPYTPA